MISVTEKNDDILLPYEKYENLISFIRKLGKAAVAFSGGTDSALLAFAAREALGSSAVAFTVWSPLLSVKDKAEILSFAESYCVSLYKIDHDDLESRDFCKNDPERCYICKSGRISSMLSFAAKLDIPWLLDGSNTDDLNDYRPGMRAIKESSAALCPFLECGLSKHDIRNISSSLDLPTAGKPSAACLASRIPAGTFITRDIIYKIDLGESIIRRYLPPDAQLRMRYDGITAKIETDRENIPGLQRCLGIIIKELSVHGVANVLIREDGYIMGGVTSRQL
ncbi:MAG: ATP-dependent sacrificial sulfur transferase LarE [Synergistaceae bacterium]|nr:ATP-dependent sacrificial sulfur transferase LarE [Synergistaceae bacterium]